MSLLRWTLLLLLLPAQVALAQFPAGIYGPQQVWGYGLDTGTDGSVFVTGNYNATATFGDDGPTLPEAGGPADGFVVAYEADGTLRWSFGFGVEGNDSGFGAEAMPDGGVIVCGQFSGTVDFDPSPDSLTLTASGTSGGFVAYYSAGGDLFWAFEVSSGLVRQAEVDVNGDVIVAGVFSGTVDFNPDSGEYVLTSRGKRDGFVAKYDDEGTFLWAYPISGLSDVEYPLALGSDPDANVYVGGFFGDSVNFEAKGSSTTLPGGKGERDAFLSSYSHDGTLRYAVGTRTITDGASADLWGLGVDDLGNAYFAGSFGEAVDFEAGSGETLATSVGALDGYLAKYDANGAFVWNSALQASDSIGLFQPRGLAVEGNGNAYLTGRFRGSFDLDPDPVGEAVIESPSSQLFLAAYMADGAHRWSFDRARELGISSGYSPSVFGDLLTLTGFFSGVLDFDPGPGEAVLDASESSVFNAFVAQYTLAGSFPTDAEVAPASRAFALSTPYPNPARHRAHLALSLDAPQHATVEVLDLLGRRIAVLHEGTAPAGETALELNAAALPSGVYVVRAAGESFSESRYVTVMR